LAAARPLSDTQLCALIALVDRARDDRDHGQERQWHRQGAVSDDSLNVHGIRRATAEALARQGLIEVRQRHPGRVLEGRATDAGIVLCDSMGD
jgi:hypothetical protein